LQNGVRKEVSPRTTHMWKPSSGMRGATRFGPVTLAAALLFGTALYSLLSIATVDITRGHIVLAACLVLLLAIVIFLVTVLTLQDRSLRRLEMRIAANDEYIAWTEQAVDFGLWRWDASSDRIWVSPGFWDELTAGREWDWDVSALKDAIHPEDRGRVTSSVK